MSRWRLLQDDGAGAATGLATDEALLTPYARGRTGTTSATLRLYTYRSHCALVGRYQDLSAEIDPAACRRLGIEWGRRPTGGGAIVMGGGQLGVAVAAPVSPERAPRETLAHYATGVVAGLAELGVQAEFRGKNDLAVNGRKIAGLGLYADDRGGVLFHASVLADLDLELMLEVLRIPGADTTAASREAIAQRITTVSRETGQAVAGADLREPLARGFARALGVTLQAAALDAEESLARDRLVAERYANDGWTAQHSPRRDSRGSAVVKTPAGTLRVYVGAHGSVIKSAMFAGAFNTLPPGLAELEAGLRWCPADRERIAALVAGSPLASSLGISAEALTGVVWAAARAALDRDRSAHPDRPAGSCYVPEAVPAGALARGAQA